METIGIIAAMSQECKALLRCVEERERTALGPFRCYRFQLSDRNCLLVKSGIGLKRAIDATRALLAATRPQFLVSFGVAGAARDELQIGDVIVASHTCLLEKGIQSQLQRLAPLSDAAWHAATHVLERRGARLVSGTAVTTRMSQPAQLQPKEMAHPFLDMETAGIAQVAAEQGIALMALRAVSDGPRAPLPFDLEAMTDEDFNLDIGKIIKMVLRHPHLMLQSHRIVRNVEKAAENAAIALVAALGQPLPVLSPCNSP
jgi:adenosylhomocysteine nucleosidase